MVLFKLARVARHSPGNGKYRAQHFLHRGLALAAGDGDHPRLGAPAIQARDSRQRQRGVADDQLRQVVRAQATHHRGRRAPPARLGHKIVAVEILPVQCEKQVPRAQLAGIGGQRPESRVAVPRLSAQFRAQFRRQRAKRHTADQCSAPTAPAARSRKAAFTASASLK